MAILLKAGQFEEGSEEHAQKRFTLLSPIEGRNGYVFALVSLTGRSPDVSPLASVIEEHTERLSGGFGKDANAQHRFEQFLRALNETLAEHVRNGSWDIPIQSVHGLVGIVCDEQMFLSGTGDLTALFLHRKPTQQYQVFNLFRSIQTEQSLPTWEKAFAVVLDGDLHAGDVFCAANKELQRFIPQDELNTILATLPPPGASAKIRQYFPHNTDLAILLIQAHSAESPTVEHATQLTAVSVEKLGETESETQRFLEDQRPKLLPLIVGLFRPKRKRTSTHAGAAPVSKWKYMSRVIGRFTLSGLKIAVRHIGQIVRGVAGFSLAMAKRERRKEKVAMTKQRADRAVTNVLQRFNKLPATSKYLMLGVVAVIFVFAISISFLSQARARSKAEHAYKTSVTKIEETRGQADAALIYKDEAKARSLFAAALADIDKLTQETDEQKATVVKLKLAIQTSLDELRHIVNIPNPPLIGDLSRVATDLLGRALFKTSDGLYVFGSDKGVYRVDAASKTVTRVETTDGTVGVASEAATEDDRVLFLDNRPGVSKFDTDNRTLQITNVAPGTNVRWTDIAAYGGKLYVLEPAGGGSDGQIVKFSLTTTGYDGGTRWIKSKSTDLTDAVSLTIDATVFVLKQNGKIVRFVGGSEVGWDAAAVDPAMTSATDIVTDAESTFVYVLEPSTQRLIVYQKDTGTFVVQYRSDAWSGLTDILIDETQKTIYLLAGSKVYSIRATHL